VFPHNDVPQVPNVLIALVVLSSLSHMDTTTTILYVHMTDVQNTMPWSGASNFQTMIHKWIQQVFLFLCDLFLENFTARFPIKVESLIPKYLNNAIVAFFFSHFDCVFTTKNKHILDILLLKCVHKFSIFLVISTWANPSRFRGGTREVGFVKKKFCSHFPMCDGGCQTLPSKQSSYFVGLNV
jgi:hypothetical protein